MLKDLFLSLPSNLLTRLNYLKQDFVDFSFNLDFIPQIIFNSLVALFIITLSLMTGRKIRKVFLNNKKILDYSFLIDISLGYIALATGVGVLGLFSLLKPVIIYLYLFIFFVISFFPFNNIPDLFIELKLTIQKTINNLKKNKFVTTWVLLFIFLALINLVNPEIREDQYHIDDPKLFLRYETTLIQPKQPPYATTVPMLSEMTYLLGIVLGSQESARYIHFLFYLLVLITLLEFSKINKYSFTIYTPLLFATAPVVIHETSSMYVDFQWIFFFLLSILILTLNQKITYLKVLISGLLLGGMMATKIWTIVFLPISTIYLIIILKNVDKKLLLKYLFVLFFAALSVSSMWYLRAYLLTGNPLYPAFMSEELSRISFSSSLYNYIGINYPLLNIFSYINVFSPLFFLGCLLFVYKIKQNLKLIFTLKLFKYLLFLLILYLSIHYPFGRYLLGLYILFIFFASIGINNLILNFKRSKQIINILLLILFSYYFVSSILILPYSFGIADKNKYLSRILVRDNSSYYDFDKKFDKYIKKDDFVATYRIYGHYYANFRFLDINFIFDKDRKYFNLLKENKITKLFIRGGDINWFCKELEITNCDSSKYTLVSSYLEFPSYYLYSIK